MNLGRYKALRNKTNKETSKKKREFESKLADRIKTNPKEFYAYVRSKTKTKDRIGPLINNAGTLTNDDKTMSEVLNKYFASVFTVEDLNTVPMAERRDNGQQPMEELQLEAIDITDEKVYEALKKL